MQYKALSIAGFDGSGGAGIQADLKTFSAFGCYGMTVLTALPVQNTCGVRNCYEIPLQAIEEQLHAIFDDIKPDAIKIGMLFNSDIIKLVTVFLKQHAQGIPIVVDPVTIAKSGDPLLLPEAVDTLISELMPLATLITPNLPEAHTFTDLNAQSAEEMIIVGQRLLALGPQHVLLKGGHLTSYTSNDLLMSHNGDSHWFESPRINSKNTHGTGCTLSAAITACLAQNIPMKKACAIAKNYLFEAIKAAKDNSVGQGHGPVHHFHHLWPISFTEF
ncbi:bifunctional hydroxymethylpyrimidine kinase/phosphomethylpyrimidine kinase [Legionella rowbothamii]|uniref:bifunctional hydroxymethylpyrimidine kinase/phosphomethylpyrimidine kinase n=1 Tax=Legionella rowbothamii TaxID=96229 RepID=UPI001056526E|nr:bifunctional hydroxymethylpyrimidine kinase/phosphomethylpyrimidine kinase [Legionella rowbothamii]